METLANVTIDTPRGKKDISVLCGDIAALDRPLDVMTVSAHTGSYYPLRGTLLGALDERGVSVQALAGSPLIDLRSLCQMWISGPIEGSLLPIGRIGCIEFSFYNRVGSTRNEDIMNKIRAYFYMLGVASSAGIPMKTLGIPLLGTGNQRISAELVSIPLLNECLRFLNQNDEIEHVYLIERDMQKASMLAERLKGSYSISKSRGSAPAAPDRAERPLAFISYSKNDRSTADALCEKLEANGVSVWYAPRNVDSPDYATAIVNAISGCSHFIVILSRDSMQSEHVLNEVDLAFQELGRKIRIYPLKLDREPLSPPFRYYLSRQHWSDASEPPLDRRLDEFVQKLRAELFRAPAASASSEAFPAPAPEPAAPAASLERFTAEHRADFARALREIRNGRKETHWMWYIFPQIRGLGTSGTSRRFAIRDLDEARAFLADPYLGGNLREICRALLALRTNDAGDVFGWPDNLKLRSSMTLFSLVSDDDLFDRVLQKFFGGEKDQQTLGILGIR